MSVVALVSSHGLSAGPMDDVVIIEQYNPWDSLASHAFYPHNSCATAGSPHTSEIPFTVVSLSNVSWLQA